MDTIDYFVLGAIVLIVALLIALYSKQQGYFFWRTWLMSTLGLGAITALILKTIGIL